MLSACWRMLDGVLDGVPGPGWPCYITMLKLKVLALGIWSDVEYIVVRQFLVWLCTRESDSL